MPQHKGGKRHKLTRSLKNKRSGKYVIQRARTTANRIRKREKHRKKNPNDNTP